ncbi:GNAT family N-acetyltransferase [Caldibacillus lycopersici]|uniref:GNAT family N-acetyltransferase n=1 Tax=Perspicuibacillus lycopersici TaxID=1325689 RepID=A0AAE3IUV5_9BACI|nr:GNAT family N-acetyltransferase [Perspicuibacillus lycopersici]MCU9614956.1 GNAT family N-acetyltransferase [Perspicuibacillus lycopersici]
MGIVLKNNNKVFIRSYEQKDFPEIQSLNKEEGWSNLVEKQLLTKEAWENSNIAFVIVNEAQEVIGYIRGLTDTRITLFICELLIDKNYRGLGLGKKLLHYVHNIYPSTRIELLASNTSRSFYEDIGFRSFYGFRKSSEEILASAK